jgi:hypothetical protein
MKANERKNIMSEPSIAPAPGLTKPANPIPVKKASSPSSATVGSSYKVMLALP